MLNENDLSEILGIKFPHIRVSDIHWRGQDSTQDSILFYKITADPKSHSLFTERINKSRYAWLVVNTDHPSRPLNSSIIPEEKWSIIQKSILDRLYPLPSLKLLAVTGTNGKTTTAELVLQLGELSGKKGLSIGTLGVRENQKTILDFGMTSPGLIDLRKFLNRYGQDKDFCVLEASSHALMQNRFFNVQFDVGGWLSFSQDHLDYHNTMEEYFAAKTLLFKHLTPTGSVYVPAIEEDLYQRIHRVTTKVQKAKRIEGPLPLFFSTSFNRSNLEVAVSMVEQAFELRVSPDHFSQLHPPNGRFYIRPYLSNFIVIDFAHTPDALDNICRGIKESFPGHSLKILFGCGGDRDRSKRPMMGKIAESWGRKIYVTSDNPRSEVPEAIIDDIVAGFSGESFVKISDRSAAVQKALSELTTNEVLLLAGKGHEDYILKEGVKYPYSDVKEVENFLRNTSHD